MNSASNDVRNASQYMRVGQSLDVCTAADHGPPLAAAQKRLLMTIFTLDLAGIGWTATPLVDDSCLLVKDKVRFNNTATG